MFIPKMNNKFFFAILNGAGLPLPEAEYRFNSDRRWRLDFAWTKEKLGVEIEGGVFSKGRHVRGKGFLADMEKYNALTVMGWRLLRFTPSQISSGEFLKVLEKSLKRR